MSSAESAAPPFTVTVDAGGIIRQVWKRATVITEASARAAMVAADELCSPVRRPLFVDMTTVSVDRPARAVFGEPSLPTRIALVGTSAVDRPIAGFVTRMSRPAVPIRFFGDESEAVAWLKVGFDGG